jgi:hypothetical protein
MEMIETYIQEVKRRLPEKSREDIGLELRSTIEDMLPDDYTENDVIAVLGTLGNPAVLASGYRDKPMHLIGPRFYDVYISLLRMIVPIAGTVALIPLVADYFINPKVGEAVIAILLNIIGEGICRLIDVSIQTFFWLTLTFAIIERVDKGKGNEPVTTKFTKWTPEDLKSITYVPKKRSISKIEVFGTLLWTAIWATAYFNAHSLAGIYEWSGDRTIFVTPAFNQDILIRYWPLVLLVIGSNIALAIYKFMKGQWTKKLAVLNALTEIVGIMAFLLIISNQSLFQTNFLTYMGNLFSVSANQFVYRVVWGSASIYIFFSLFNMYDGFRKAARDR